MKKNKSKNLKPLKPLSEKEIEAYKAKLRSFSNRAKYDDAYKLAHSLMQKYPKVLYFAYYEAVMTAEDTTGLTKKQADQRYRLAVKKLKAVLKRMRGASSSFRGAIRNEYYWFSKQPYKQYLLGVEEERTGAERGGFYSQGVGASMIAQKYGLAKKVKLALKWAKISEQAWLNFFKRDATWFNSYFFYARALGYQGRFKESDQALAKAARIAKRPKNWKAIVQEKREIRQVHTAMYK